jgi:hypothetical protein
MFSVRAVQRYNLPLVNTVDVSLCLVTHVHTHRPPLEAVHYTQTNVTLPAEIQRAACLLVQRTHATPQLDLVYPLKGH